MGRRRIRKFAGLGDAAETETGQRKSESYARLHFSAPILVSAASTTRQAVRGAPFFGVALSARVGFLASDPPPNPAHRMQHLPPLSNGKGDSQPANGGGDSQPAPVLARAQPAMQTPVRAKSESSQDAVSIHVDPHIPRQRDSALEIQAVERLPSQMVVGPRAKFFSLHGELIHAFVSYRVVTEGPAGNRLSGTIAQRIRALSLEELQLPRHGWGLW